MAAAIFYAIREVLTRMAIRKLKKYKPTKFKAKDSHYDKDAADYAVMFIESLCHTKGTWAGKPFELIMSPVKASDLKAADATQPSYRVHTVVKGDTLWDIAVKYLGKGSRYVEIKELNGLTSNVIYSGMKLKIPN